VANIVWSLRQIDNSDGLRAFGPLGRDDASKVKAAILERLASRFSSMEGRRIEIISMRSLAGTPRQAFGGVGFHTDYEPQVREDGDPNSKSCSLIIAQQDGTPLLFLDLTKENGSQDYKVMLNTGDAVVWKHDTIHSGGAYEAENHRLFAYVSDKYLRHQKNSVSLPPLPPRIQATVPPNRPHHTRVKPQGATAQTISLQGNPLDQGDERGGGEKQKTPKKRKIGGASFHSSDKSLLEVLKTSLVVPVIVQTPDRTGWILYRTEELAGTRKVGDNCALDTLNFSLGDKSLIKAADLQETSKIIYGEEKCVPSWTTILKTVERKKMPFRLEKVKKMTQGEKGFLMLLMMTKGIFMLRAQVHDGKGGYSFHFYGLDAWRRLIYDNDKDVTRRYVQWGESDMANSGTAKALFTELGMNQIYEVYVVKVLAARTRETKYA
jgi:hypothetical protein